MPKGGERGGGVKSPCSSLEGDHGSGRRFTLTLFLIGRDYFSMAQLVKWLHLLQRTREELEVCAAE